MSQHLHREYVDGCFRCDLSRVEVSSAERAPIEEYLYSPTQVRAEGHACAINYEGCWMRGKKNWRCHKSPHPTTETGLCSDHLEELKEAS